MAGRLDRDKIRRQILQDAIANADSDPFVVARRKELEQERLRREKIAQEERIRQETAAARTPSLDSFGSVEGMRNALAQPTPEPAQTPEEDEGYSIWDVGVSARQGAAAVTKGALGLPVNAANLIAAPFMDSPIQQPKFVRGMREVIDEQQKDIYDRQASDKLKAKNLEFQAQEGLVDTAIFAITNPAWMGLQAFQQGPQVIAAGPGGVAQKVVTGALSAASQAEEAVSTELRKQGLSEEEIARNSTNAFAASLALNAATPYALKSTFLEGLVARQAKNRVTNGVIREALSNVGKETAEGIITEVGDQYIQNINSGKKAGEGLAQAAVLGAAFSAAVAGPAATIESAAEAGKAASKLQSYLKEQRLPEVDESKDTSLSADFIKMTAGATPRTGVTPAYEGLPALDPNMLRQAEAATASEASEAFNRSPVGATPVDPLRPTSLPPVNAPLKGNPDPEFKKATQEAEKLISTKERAIKSAEKAKFTKAEKAAKERLTNEALKLPADERVTFIRDNLAAWRETNKPQTTPATVTTDENTPSIPVGTLNNSLQNAPESSVALPNAAGNTGVGATLDDVSRAVGGGKMDKLASRLSYMVEDGNLEIVQRQDQIPGDIGKMTTRGKGWYDPNSGKTYLVAENLDPQNTRGDILSTLAHETKHGADFGGSEGLAISFKNFVGAEANQRMAEKIRAAAAKGDKSAQYAISRVDSPTYQGLGLSADQTGSEIVANYISAESQKSGVTTSLYRGIVSPIRAGAKKLLRSKDVSLGDIHYMADKLVSEVAARGERIEGGNGGVALPMVLGFTANNFQAAQDAGRAFQSRNGNYKFVISDKDSTLQQGAPARLAQGEALPLGEVIDHPELYDNYTGLPQAIDVTVDPSLKGSATNGYWDRNKFTIAVSPEAVSDASKNSDNFRGLILHEVQHAIQDVEGHPRGGNSDMFKDTPDYIKVKTSRDNTRRLTSALLQGLVHPQLSIINDTTPATTVATIKKLVEESKKDKSLLASNAKQVASLLEDGILNEQTLGVISKLNELGTKLELADNAVLTKDNEAFAEYWNLYGEEEARFTQDNRNASLEELPINPEETMGYGATATYDDNDSYLPLAELAHSDPKIVPTKKAVHQIDTLLKQARDNLKRAISLGDKKQIAESTALVERLEGMLEQTNKKLVPMPNAVEERYVPKILPVAKAATKTVKLKDGTEAVLILSPTEEGELSVIATIGGVEVGSLDAAMVEQDGIRFNPHIDVSKAWRRKGIASALYDMAEDAGALIPDVNQKGQVRTDDGEAFRRSRAARSNSKPMPNAVEGEVMPRATKDNATHKIVDRQTGKIVDWAIGISSALRKVDNRDNAYGGYRYSAERVRENDDPAVPQKAKAMPSAVEQAEQDNRTWWEKKKDSSKVVRIVDDLLSTTEGLGLDMFKLFDTRQGLRGDLSLRAEAVGKRMETGIRKAASARGTTINKISSEIEKKLVDINKLPTKEAREAAVKELDKAYPGVGTALNEMRNLKWALSRKIVEQRHAQGGDLTPKEQKIYGAILENAETYTTRAYMSGQMPSKKFAKRRLAEVEKNPQGEEAIRFNEALKFLVDNHLAIPSKAKLLSMEGKDVRKFYESHIGDSSGVELDAMVEKLDAIPRQSKEYYNEKALEIAKELMGLKKTRGAVARGYAGARQNRTILEGRENVPDEIRFLMGEITNPLAAEMLSVARLINLYTQTNMLQSFKEQGKDRWYKDHNVGDFNIQLKDDAYGPIKGMWVTPSAAKFLEPTLTIGLDLEQALSKGTTDLGELLKIGYNAFKVGAQKTTGVVKLADLVTSPIAMMWNYIGAYGIVAQNGANPKYILKAQKNTANAIRAHYNPSKYKPEEMAEVQELIRSRVLDSATVGEFQQSFYENMFRFMEDAQREGGKNLGMRLARSIEDKTMVAKDVYAFMDMWAKVAAYYDRRDFLTSYYKANGDTVSKEDIIREAGADITAANISYTRAFKFIKVMERNVPMFTMYLTYFSEVPRSIVFSLALAGKDFKRAAASKSPDARNLANKQGVTRMAGTLAMTALLTSVVNYYLDGLGDDEERRRKTDPEWEQRGVPIPAGKSADGKLVTFNILRADPNGPLNEFMTHMANLGENEDLSDALVKTVKSQFVEAKPVMATLRLLSGLAGRETTNYEDDHGAFADALDDLSYGNDKNLGRNLMSVLEGFTPRVIKGTYRSITGTIGNRHYEFDPVKEPDIALIQALGMTPSVRDPEFSLEMATSKYKEVKRGVGRDLKGMEDRFDKLSGKDLINKLGPLIEEEEKAYNALWEVYDGTKAFNGYYTDKDYNKAANTIIKDAKLGNASSDISNGSFNLRFVSKDFINKWRDARVSAIKEMKDANKKSAAMAALRNEYRMVKDYLGSANKREE